MRSKDEFSGIFKVLLVLHILSAIVGLGGVMLNGLYAAQAQKRPGPAGPRGVRGELRGVERRGEVHLPRSRCSASCSCSRATGRSSSATRSCGCRSLLFIVAIGVSHSVLIPGHKKINALLLEMEQGPPPVGGPPPQVAQIQALGKQQAAAGVSLNVVLVVILVLMIWQPR